MEYRVCRNNPAPYNDLNGKIGLLGLQHHAPALRDAADQTSIDEEKAQEIFDYAYAHGVNYFDTAYPYHGGISKSSGRSFWPSIPRQLSSCQQTARLAVEMR